MAGEFATILWYDMEFGVVILDCNLQETIFIYKPNLGAVCFHGPKDGSEERRGSFGKTRQKFTKNETNFYFKLSSHKRSDLPRIYHFYN